MRAAALRTPLVAVLWTWLLLGTLPASAQEPAAKEPTVQEPAAQEPAAKEPAAPESSWAYFTVATGPIERVEAFFEEMGVPLPVPLRRERIEHAFGFIGPEGLRGTGSLGMLMGPGDPGSLKPNAILLFPITEDVARLKDFTDRGAQPLPGSGDTVRIRGSLFRRTAGFVLLGSNESYITQTEPLALEEHLSAPGLLAELDLDLGRWRKTDPASFYSMFAEKERRRGDDGSHVAELGRALGMRIFDKLLERMRLTLLDSDDSLLVRVGLEPLAPGELAPLPRPAFPSGVIGRVDIAYASEESSQWLRGVTQEFLGALEKDRLFADAERSKVDVNEMRGMIQEVFELMWTADAISIAVEPVQGRLVYHQVNQYRSPAGFTARMAAVVKKMARLERQPRGRGTGVGLTTYNAAGARITRFTLPGKEKLTVDFVDSGTTVRIVAAADSQRRLSALLKLPADGTLTSGFSGEFDPSAAVDAYLVAGGNLPLPLRMREELRDQRITWTTRAEGSAAVVDFDVPKPLAKAFIRLLDNRVVDMEEP